MKTNHTPGPWKTIMQMGETAIVPADCVMETQSWTNNVALAKVYKQHGKYDDIANAQLIADAPELLELCQELLGPMIVWSQYWGNAYNGGKSSPAHKEIIQRASIVIARNTHEDAE